MTTDFQTGHPTSGEPGAGSAGAILTIDLGALADNYRRLQAEVQPAECAAVVKANAYGLGIAEAASALWHAGARRYFVALPDEALVLRRLLPDAWVGVLGGVWPETAGMFVAHRLVPVLNSLADIDMWRGVCHDHQATLEAVVHLDTGMNRLGLGPDEQATLVAEPRRMAGMTVACYMSHLASADLTDDPMSEDQAGRLEAVAACLPPAPLSLANSFGAFRGERFHKDIARPGCALYGVNPTPGRTNPMQGVVRLDARILQVRRVDSPMTVGYGATHRVRGPGRVATISMGYADGFLRSLSNSGSVYVDGIACPIIGRISMDLTTVDVSHLPNDRAMAGQRVEVIGPNRPVDAVADDAGTIGYEILTSLGRRYHRHYISAETATS